MKKLMIFAIAISFILSANILNAQDEPEFKKYDMISGYVEYKLTGYKTGTEELYFEEYGKYIAVFSKGDFEYQEQKGHFNEESIMVPEGFYQMNLDQAKGIKGPAIDYSKLIEQFELAGGDFNKATEQYMKSEGYIKQGNEKVLDHDCVIWEISEKGASLRLSIWKGIKLKYIQTTPDGLTFTKEAVKVVEEEAIPFAKFEVPEGIQWLDPKTGQPIKEK